MVTILNKMMLSLTRLSGRLFLNTNQTSDTPFVEQETSITALNNIKLAVQIMIVMAVVLGVIYVIVLSVQYIKGEGDEQAKAKRRMVNAMIGYVVLLAAAILMFAYINNIVEVNTWVQKTVRSIFGPLGDLLSPSDVPASTSSTSTTPLDGYGGGGVR